MSFHMSTHHNASAGPRVQTFGLFAPHERVGDHQHQPLSHLSNSPLNATDPLSNMLSTLTLGDFTPQVPVQPQQGLAIKQAQHANTQDGSQYKADAANYKRMLIRHLRKSVHPPVAVEPQGEYPDVL
ncbi:hypothetical protein FRC08_005989 [Ceratobasidium sp. 394]|nr:hypothetical protein FRC08_005989 [Ceratobasidium sp. 394]KAG9088080.1 hypothetical protein FS749_002443 [Ceratobasidium sp. UAMH 11750]